MYVRLHTHVHVHVCKITQCCYFYIHVVVFLSEYWFLQLLSVVLVALCGVAVAEAFAVSCTVADVVSVGRVVPVVLVVVAIVATDQVAVCVIEDVPVSPAVPVAKRVASEGELCGCS